MNTPFALTGIIIGENTDAFVPGVVFSPTGDDPEAGGLSSTTVALLGVGAAIVFLLVVLIVVFCLICHIKPDSSIAVSYRERKATWTGGPPPPMVTAGTVRGASGVHSTTGTVHRNNNNNHQHQHHSRQRRNQGAASPRRQPVAAMHFGPAPTVSAQRPSNDMYQKVPSMGGGGHAQAVALWKFVPQQAGDLAFDAGDVIQLLQHSKGWWEGRCNGRQVSVGAVALFGSASHSAPRQGVFPSTYVQLTRESSWSPSAPPPIVAPLSTVVMDRRSHYNARAQRKGAATVSAASASNFPAQLVNAGATNDDLIEEPNQLYRLNRFAVRSCRVVSCLSAALCGGVSHSLFVIVVFSSNRLLPTC